MKRRKARAVRQHFAVRFAQLHGRLLLSAAVGAAVAAALFATDWRLPTKLLTGWDCGVALYLALTYWVTLKMSVPQIRARAARDDEGAFALLLLVVASAIVSLGAIVWELGNLKQTVGMQTAYEAALGAVTILLSWSFMHTIFALHYAHEYYGEGRDRATGGLNFPGRSEPDYSDFIYFSVVIAMTSQVSDVAISSKEIRRMATAHGVLSFFFNFAILALTVNILSSLLGQ